MLEYVEGVSLAQLGHGCWLPPAEIAEIAAQLEHALQDLHARGVFHGDLSPQNVLIDTSGRLRLLDFGLANGTRVSPPFAAPERLAGGPADAAGDLFALGRVLEFLGREAAAYLHAEPTRRKFQDLSPSQATQEELARKVVQWRARHTQVLGHTLTARRPKVGFTKFLVLATAGALLAVLLPAAGSAHKNARYGQLNLRTKRWHYFTLDGVPLGYAPLVVPLELEKSYRLQWTSAGGNGQKMLRLRGFADLSLEDSDFSH